MFLFYKLPIYYNNQCFRLIFTSWETCRRVHSYYNDSEILEISSKLIHPLCRVNLDDKNNMNGSDCNKYISH